MNNEVRKITEGAMMVAIVGILIFINRQMMGVMIYFLWAVPLPMVFFAAKYGWKDGLLPLSAIVFLTLILGGIQSSIYFVTMSISGLIYGNGVRKKQSQTQLIVIIMIVSILLNLSTMVLFAGFFGYDINMQVESMKQVMDQVMGDQVALISMDLGSFIKTILIMSAVLTGVMEAFLTHFFSSMMLRRFGFNIPKPKPLSQIAFPKWSGYVAFILWIFSSRIVLVDMNIMLQELLLVASTVSTLYLVFTGYIGVLVFGAVKYKRNIGIYVLIFILFFFNIAIPAISVFGFLYITTDWRINLLKGGK